MQMRRRLTHQVTQTLPRTIRVTTVNQAMQTSQRIIQITNPIHTTRTILTLAVLTTTTLDTDQLLARVVSVETHI